MSLHPIGTFCWMYVGVHASEGDDNGVDADESDASAVFEGGLEERVPSARSGICASHEHAEHGCRLLWAHSGGGAAGKDVGEVNLGEGRGDRVYGRRRRFLYAGVELLQVACVCTGPNGNEKGILVEPCNFDTRCVVGGSFIEFGEFECFFGGNAFRADAHVESFECESETGEL